MMTFSLGSMGVLLNANPAILTRASQYRLVERRGGNCDMSASYRRSSEGATTKEYPCGLSRRSNAARGGESRRDGTGASETFHSGLGRGEPGLPLVDDRIEALGQVGPEEVDHLHGQRCLEDGLGVPD